MPFISSVRGNYRPKPKNDSQIEIIGGDEVITAGGYRIHIFNNVGENELKIKSLRHTDKMNLQLDSTVLTAEYLVIAGGGSGGVCGLSSSD